MEALVPFVPVWQAAAWSAFVIFLRIGAIMATLPAFGEQTIPVRVRLALAICFTVIVYPNISPVVPSADSSFIAVGALVGSEVITGLFFGLLLRFFVFALQITGSIAAQTTSLSQIFGGSAGVDPQPAIGHVLVIAGLALAASLGLHVQFAKYMLLSYDFVAIGMPVPSGLVADIGLTGVSKTFALAFSLAAPFMIGSLVYNVTLGVINKAMPQLMVSFVGAPAITAGGLLFFMLSAPIILSIWIDAFAGFVAVPGSYAR